MDVSGVPGWEEEPTGLVSLHIALEPRDGAVSAHPEL
jgi:hypothetical protein